MGIFGTSKLNARAQRLAQRFALARNENFDFIVNQLRKHFVQTTDARELTAGSEPDQFMRGFQLWLHVAFSVVHPYVEREHFQEFSGCMNQATSGSFQSGVSEYFLRVNSKRNNIDEAFVEIGFCICEYIAANSDPRTLAFVGTLIPFLAINTQIEIAGEFRDLETATRLRNQGRLVWDGLNGQGLSARAGHSLTCMNCALAHAKGYRLCTLCGIPLIELVLDEAIKTRDDDVLRASSIPRDKPCEKSKNASLPLKVPAQIPVMTEEMVAKGTDFRQGRFKGISNWEERMYSEFGEQVLPHLAAIWNRVSQGQ
jgi:hypothetical protein